jgi:Domain of unknown function (DUF4287)
MDSVELRMIVSKTERTRSAGPLSSEGDGSAQAANPVARTNGPSYASDRLPEEIMSFQAYIDNIKAKTGLSPPDFKARAEAKGFLKDGQLSASTKATEVTDWLKAEFGLGHGHAMAIYATFKGKSS